MTKAFNNIGGIAGMTNLYLEKYPIIYIYALAFIFFHSYNHSFLLSFATDSTAMQIIVVLIDLLLQQAILDKKSDTIQSLLLPICNPIQMSSSKCNMLTAAMNKTAVATFQLVAKLYNYYSKYNLSFMITLF